MEDTGQRKSPPDRPPETLPDAGRNKKKKVDLAKSDFMDDNMEESEVVPETDLNMVNEKERSFHSLGMSPVDDSQKTQGLSYKQSLLGFNGMANGGECMEADDLFDDDRDIFWEMPEPTEEVQRLKKLYPVVPISSEEYNEWCKPWNFSLIITVLGRRFNLYMLKSHLTKIWGFSEFDLIDIPNNCFVVKLSSQERWREHYRKVLYEGPWTIAHHCILVQRWTPYFDPFKNQLGRIVTWVRIPHIPMHCYNSHCIARLGERIGRPLRVDLNTLANGFNADSKVERGRYARICVELDLQKQLVPRIIAANSVFNVEYEGLKLICFECGRYGHRHEACPWKKSAQPMHSGNNENSQASVPPEKKPEIKLPEKEETFGPWMLVNRSSKAQVSMSRTQLKGRAGVRLGAGRERNGGSMQSKSRFAVLEELEDGVIDGTEFQDDVKVDQPKGASSNVKISLGPSQLAMDSSAGKKGMALKPTTIKMNGSKKVYRPKSNQSLQLKEEDSQKAMILVGQRKPKSLSQQTHIIVSGSMDQLGQLNNIRDKGGDTVSQDINLLRIEDGIVSPELPLRHRISG